MNPNTLMVKKALKILTNNKMLTNNKTVNNKLKPQKSQKLSKALATTSKTNQKLSSSTSPTPVKKTSNPTANSKLPDYSIRRNNVKMPAVRTPNKFLNW